MGVSSSVLSLVNRKHKPAHFVLLWTLMGKQEQRSMLPAQGIAQRTVVLEPSHGEHLALAMQEGQSRAGYLGEIVFHGAVAAAYECSFPLWRSRAVTAQEAREVTFWPSFCLSYLPGTSQIQVVVSQYLCFQG